MSMDDKLLAAQALQCWAVDKKHGDCQHCFFADLEPEADDGTGTACNLNRIFDTIHKAMTGKAIPNEMPRSGKRNWWFCGECAVRVRKGDRFCWNCGIGINWEWR